MLVKILFLFSFGWSILIGSSKFVFIKSQQNNIIDTLKTLTANSATTDKNFPNTLNNIVKDSISGMPMLIGKCTREAFKDSSFNWWWMSEYDLYDIDSTNLNGIKNDLKNVNIKIVMGTWCSDSRREVPRFFKILDAVNYPSDKVEIVCVDEDKTAKGDELKDLNIELVPTIIFYKDGNELGRIIEAPKETLEKDMIKILTAHS